MLKNMRIAIGVFLIKKLWRNQFITICIVMHPVSNLYDTSTHWPHGDVEVILQVNFSISFFKLISWALPVELVSAEQTTFDHRPTLVQVIAWCYQATYHYLSQCWSRMMSPFGVTKPQIVNIIFPKVMHTFIVCYWTFQGHLKGWWLARFSFLSVSPAYNLEQNVCWKFL